MNREFIDVTAVYTNRSNLWLVEFFDQFQHCRFTSPSVSHDAEEAPRLDIERDIVEHVDRRSRVSECYAVERD